jgi:EAL and modified HD-GYP domain-containing signal transduction protein
MLRLVNSALFQQRREITSIRQALTFLGIDKIRSWVHLLSLGKLENKPAALFTTTLVRARFGQLLAERAAASGLQADSQFTIGLLSTLDAFLGIELAEILDSIAVPRDMREALVEQQGSNGLLLKVALAYERAEFDAIDWQQLQTLGLDAQGVQQAYLDSLNWADENLQLLN